MRCKVIAKAEDAAFAVTFDADAFMSRWFVGGAPAVMTEFVTLKCNAPSAAVGGREEIQVERHMNVVWRAFCL